MTARLCKTHHHDRCAVCEGCRNFGLIPSRTTVESMHKDAFECVPVGTGSVLSDWPVTEKGGEFERVLPHSARFLKLLGQDQH